MCKGYLLYTKCFTISLLQDLPGDKATQWDDFVSNALAEVNRKNEITPLPVSYFLLYFLFTRNMNILIDVL